MVTTELTTKRFVRSAYRRGRKVRILSNAFGYGNKVGVITSVGMERIYVRVSLGKKPQDWDEVAYLPEHVRLI